MPLIGMQDIFRLHINFENQSKNYKKDNLASFSFSYFIYKYYFLIKSLLSEILEG